MKQAPFVAIAGNIGTGKSTLARLLTREFGFERYEEPVRDNPFLAPFYTDLANAVTPSAHACRLQKYFLLARATAHLEILGRGRPVILDRTVWEDREIFARALHENGFLSDEDHAEYEAIYRYATKDLPAPSLMIFLEAPLTTLRERISARARQFETTLADPAHGYLGQLQRLYAAWMESWDQSETMTLDSAETDFVADRSAQEMIVRAVQKRLALEPETLFDS